MNNEVKINAIAKTFGTMLIKSGINTIRSSADDFVPVVNTARIVNDAFDKVGLKPVINQLDINYYYTDWENWQKIIEVLYGIIKDFKWEAERFDCDQRSALMTTLCGILFRLNTCGGFYCEVKTPKTTYLHWANIIITKDGELYLFDIDNGGKVQKITSNNIVMGNRTYKLISIRIY